VYVWSAYYSALPDGVLPAAATEPLARAVERGQLVSVVGAEPERVVSTFVSDMFSLFDSHAKNLTEKHAAD
jgi:hypothetical protein